jgi:hypothetical protein
LNIPSRQKKGRQSKYAAATIAPGRSLLRALGVNPSGIGGRRSALANIAIHHQRIRILECAAALGDAVAMAGE